MFSGESSEVGDVGQRCAEMVPVVSDLTLMLDRRSAVSLLRFVVGRAGVLGCLIAASHAVYRKNFMYDCSANLTVLVQHIRCTSLENQKLQNDIVSVPRR